MANNLPDERELTRKEIEAEQLNRRHLEGVRRREPAVAMIRILLILFLAFAGAWLGGWAMASVQYEFALGAIQGLGRGSPEAQEHSAYLLTVGPVILAGLMAYFGSANFFGTLVSYDRVDWLFAWAEKTVFRKGGQA